MLYRETEVYNNIMNSIKLYITTDTLYLNSKNSGTFNPDRLLLNHRDKINLKRSDTYVALSKVSIYYIWKNIKKS